MLCSKFTIHLPDEKIARHKYRIGSRMCLPVANSLFPRQENRTMHQPNVKFGNSVKACRSTWVSAVRWKDEEEDHYGHEAESGAGITGLSWRGKKSPPLFVVYERRYRLGRRSRRSLIAGSRRTSAAPPLPATKVEVPKFVVDPSWPHIPNGWTLGQVSSAAADADGNIWIIHRSRTVKPGVKTGPPVMEFDAAGNYIQGWGGKSGDGYTWPSTEHGITVDYKGYVWISGNGNDDQILKFTKDGKFLMQIGHAAQKKTNADTTSLWKPADVFVYPKTNEIFVADGYGNKRVIVFDADTGAYKRMWGAFGNTPMDDPPRPPALTGEAAKAAAEEEEATRTLATGFDPKDPGPSQFVPPVHGVKVSNDGLVYVADRGGKRVQVFTTDGKYITQVWIDRWCLVAGGRLQ